ncbi:cation diffusion facilitator family transporter [Aspergillus melleus]|uniref:cation diffusion facilitator family transporter n=1 Tax=Aspergillus melleus TaxID=138277 RepID=UPI001E8DF8D2|nr:uncharacterized protein LDX57_007053 [Aspergillus melleus]KAH8429389.1 hypothetical protein LDX57_007053 [Aspergillus melleus]
MGLKISRTQRLSAVIAISTSFFIAEISVGFYTHSLALIADAFHYLNDLIGFIIALIAVVVANKRTPPKALTYGWQRAELLGAFFNGVLLFGLGISVFLQSIERFISLQPVENPKLVLIIGSIGLGLNIISVLFLHEHDHGHDHSHGHSHDDHGTANEADLRANTHSHPLPNEMHVHHKHQTNAASASAHRPGHDLAIMGVLIHVLGDAGNNLGVMAAALVIWLADYGGRYYADPAASMGIALMIFASSIPLIKRAGLVLLQSAPGEVDPDDVKHDLERIPGVRAIHELHIWRLNQAKSLASAHILLTDEAKDNFSSLAKTINECFHAYGIHSVTLQPEVWSDQKGFVATPAGNGTDTTSVQSVRPGVSERDCQLVCGKLCEDLLCC